MDRLLRPQTRQLDVQVTLSARGGEGVPEGATSIPPRSTAMTKSVAIPKARGSGGSVPVATLQRSAKREPSSDLLVRFGFASFLGRMLARVLAVLLFLQPVYVAMGMELPEGDAGGNDTTQENQEDVVDEPTEEDVAAEEEQEVVEEEPTQSEENVQETATNESAETGEVEDSDDTEQVADTETTPQTENTDTDTSIEDDSGEESTETVSENSDDSEGESTDSTESGSSDENTDDDGSGTIEQGADDTEGTDDSGEEAASDDEIDSGTEADGGDAASSTHEIASTTDDTVSGTDTDDSDTTDNDTDESGTSGGGAGGGSGGTTEDETESEEVATSTATTTDEHVDENATTTDGVGSGASTTTSETLVERTQEPEATTTATTTEETAEINVAQNPQSKFVFGESECTIVTSGEFYCVSATEKKGTVPGEARVYTRIDLDGDKEIFYHNGIEEKRITNNSYDDMAPVLEEDEQRIVWHGMRNDRLQIFLYDIRTGVTDQVTNNSVNSNNPHIHGDTLVWQEWGDNNWDIMMVEDIDDGFDVEQVTENGVHDMFPQVYDDLVTWQRERGAGFEVVVMDRTTGKETVLEKHGDGRYENPRFALLFDTRQDNGDTQTVGFDINTGEIVQLGSKPYDRPLDNPVTPDEELPEAIPSSSTTTPKLEERTVDDTAA